MTTRCRSVDLECADCPSSQKAYVLTTCLPTLQDAVDQHGEELLHVYERWERQLHISKHAINILQRLNACSALHFVRGAAAAVST